jgi:hypothetical protein
MLFFPPASPKGYSLLIKQSDINDEIYFAHLLLSSPHLVDISFNRDAPFAIASIITL